MSDNNKFANQFIDLWQENFEKMLSSGENMHQMQQVFENMKGFYAKPESQNPNEPATAADCDAHMDGDANQLVRALSSRIDELEARIANLERKHS